MRQRVTHSDLLRGHSQYVGRSLKVNGPFCRDTYRALSVWLEANPDFQQLWIDYGVGRRWCLVMGAILGRSPSSFSSSAPLPPAIDNFVASLVALGVPGAARLEDELAKL